MKKSSKILIALAFTILGVGIAVAIALGGLYMYSKAYINPATDEALFQASKGGNITKFYANGAPLGSEEYIPLEIESVSHLTNRREWYSIEDISDTLKGGFLAVEDREFYEHEGVNMRRTFLALVNSIFKFRDRFGASTITQQVIKNISGDNDVSVRRKLNEIIRAFNIEKNHSKEEILELYLNIVPMGERSTGVGLASEIYFGKEPSELSIDEAAVLVGLANAPTRYSPYKNREACIEKRNFVLASMLDFGVITAEEYEVAVNTETEFLPRKSNVQDTNSWFIETVIADITNDFVKKYKLTEETARKLVCGGGFSIYTTESEYVQKKLDSFFENTDNLPNEVALGLEYGMVVVDSRNGNLLGIIGQAGKKEGDRLLNHAAVPHLPASCLKPIALYAPLIDEGVINWATVLDDTPRSFFEKNGVYTEYPKNSPSSYDGLITVEEAVRRSKNTAAVKLYDMLGGRKIYDSLKNRFGFTTLVEKDVSNNGVTLTDISPSPLALGQLTRGVPLRKLTEAYTVFANDGILNKQRSYIKVVDNKGSVVLENTPEQTRVFKQSTARIMTQLLAGVVNNGTAKTITLKDIVDTAGKTGTSGLNRDKLFMGYTPYFTAGIWSGYADGTTPIESPTPSHLSIWDSIMRDLHENELENTGELELRRFSTQGLEKLSYCLDSGMIYDEVCTHDLRGERIGYGYFTSDNKPEGKCNRHIAVDIDIFDNKIAEHDCPKERRKRISLLKLPDRSFPKCIYIPDQAYSYEEYTRKRELA